MTDIIAILRLAESFGLEIDEAQHKEFEDFVTAIMEQERQKCWDAVNEQITGGELPGNGTDKTAERNGLVLATNIIAGLN